MMVHQVEMVRFITLILINIPEVVSADECSCTIVGEEGVTEEEDVVVLVDYQSSLREPHVFFTYALLCSLGFICCLCFQ